MRDLKLGKDRDLLIEGFDLKLTADSEIVEQRLRQALLTFKGEWFLNVDLGIPYYQEILGQKNSIDSVKAILINAIKKVDGVKELVELNLNLNEQNNVLVVQLNIIDDANNVLKIEV